jgi:hypothetical protein
MHRQAEVGEAKGGIRLGGRGQLGLPLFPAPAIFPKGILDGLDGTVSVGRESGDPDFPEE